MKRFLFGTLFLIAIAVAAFFLWMRSGGGAAVELSDADMEAARESGAAAKEIVVDAGAEGEPALPTLEELKLIASRQRMDDIAAQIEGKRTEATGDEAALLTVLLSEVERLRGNIDEAYDLALAGAEALPDNSRARHMLAKAILGRIMTKVEAGNFAGLFKVFGDVKTYKAEVKAAVELDPTNVDARVGQILTMLAPAPLGNKSKAVELIDELSDLDPLRHGFWQGQILAIDDDRQDEAIAAFEKLLEEHPTDADMLLTLGELYMKKGTWVKAIETFDRQIVEPRTPQAFRALYQGAKARYRAKTDLGSALTMLQEFESADPVGEPMPTMDRVLFHKGRVLAGLDRLTEAKASFEASLQLNPKTKRVKKALAELMERINSNG